MKETFEQFIKEYTKSINDNGELINSLKKQYEMYKAEKDATTYLKKKYYTNKIKRIQFVPTDFDYLTNNDTTGSMLFNENIFWFKMGTKNTFVLDNKLFKETYLIEGISTTAIKGINIKNVLFYINNECVHTVAGYQINDLYYLETPIIIKENEKLEIKVSLTHPCNNFPILFIGYKFYVDE